MNADKSTEDTTEAGSINAAIDAYHNDEMSLSTFAESLGMDTLAARNLLQERGVRLHEQDIIEVPIYGTHDASADEETLGRRSFASREWTIQSFHVDRWVDDTAQDRPYTFEEMKDALARRELLHFEVRHRGYNNAQDKSYEPR